MVTGAAGLPRLNRPPLTGAEAGDADGVAAGEAQAVDKTSKASKEISAIIRGYLNMKTTPSF